ncbi:hypothetical protein Dimus_021828 [Dionaea muscipula]
MCDSRWSLTGLIEDGSARSAAESAGGGKQTSAGRLDGEREDLGRALVESMLVEVRVVEGDPMMGHSSKPMPRSMVGNRDWKNGFQLSQVERVDEEVIISAEDVADE